LADPANFLARWSRLKKRARTTPAPADAAAPPATAAPDMPAPDADLPSIESLTAESDFSPFMRPGVPEAARNAALQKLWRSDPVFANLDGLVEYGEDFAADFKSAAVVRTVYRVLQGMPSDRGSTPDVTSTDASSTAPPEGTPAVATNAADTLATEPDAEPSAAAGGRTDNDGLD
jgi:Protein of unknown function (DUF3306)